MTTPQINPHVAAPVGRYSLGEFPRYDMAQSLVDHLSDQGFPVENVAIVGSRLTTVEQVTGRLTTARAAVVGGTGGAWFGLFLGLFFGLFAASGTAFVLLLLYGVVGGALFGGSAAAVRQASTGGKRDFASVQGLVAGSYEVLVDQEHAAQGEQLTARWRA